MYHRLSMNGDLTRMWKGMIKFYFNVLSQESPKGPSHEKL
jgi:hypothetical protein